ncbi:MAG: hypothetical protein M0037_05980 [Betaproteobacteria bacterium]|nr:hypothetical protein [Betaproteobacteria bacterium]
MLNFFVSTIAFFVAAFFIWRYLHERGFGGKGLKSAVVLLASVVSWGAGSAADWAANKVDPPPIQAKTVHSPKSAQDAAVKTLLSGLQ